MKTKTISYADNFALYNLQTNDVPNGYILLENNYATSTVFEDTSVESVSSYKTNVNPIDEFKLMLAADDFAPQDRFFPGDSLLLADNSRYNFTCNARIISVEENIATFVDLDSMTTHIDIPYQTDFEKFSQDSYSFSVNGITYDASLLNYQLNDKTQVYTLNLALSNMADLYSNQPIFIEVNRQTTIKGMFIKRNFLFTDANGYCVFKQHLLMDGAFYEIIPVQFNGYIRDYALIESTKLYPGNVIVAF